MQTKDWREAIVETPWDLAVVFVLMVVLLGAINFSTDVLFWLASK